MLFVPLLCGSLWGLGLGQLRAVVPPSGSNSQRVGQFCRFNTDCISGAFCSNSRCLCWSTHVAVNAYCWPKINPSQAGCSHEEQCSAVWPGASCYSGTCVCPDRLPPQTTRDGPICFIPGSCPTNGKWPKLKSSQTTTDVACTVLPAGVLTPTAPATQVGCEVSFKMDNVYDCIVAGGATNGYCCPTKALTCIQQMDVGTTGNLGISSTRWYFNSISQTCQSFRYNGQGGNANNFLSQLQCESYCMQGRPDGVVSGCPRGHPEYLPTNPTTAVSGVTVKYCNAGSGGVASTCATNYECHSHGSTQLCCPKVAYICGPDGGSPGGPGDAEKSGTGAFGMVAENRWFYDAGSGRCQTFVYYGQGGNFNNFISQEDCQSYCGQAQCTRGSPLPSASGIGNRICSSSADCPSTHDCIGTYCCPSRYTICNQPRVIGGSCSNFATRFFYNPASGTCEEFLYTGCRGNGNNFEDFLSCQNYCSQVGGEPKCRQGSGLKNSATGQFYRCTATAGGSTSTNVIECPQNYDCFFDGNVYGCCPSRDYTCSLTSEVGRQCGPTSSPRWFFDPTDRTCKTFIYQGCDGNSNNFATQRDCKDFCRADGCPDGGEPYRLSGNTVQLCTGSNVIASPFSPTVTCPAQYTCVTVSAATVGSLNVPVSVGQLFVSYCCPRKSTICGMAMDSGANCGQSLARFAFSRASRSCQPFTYLGCGGNVNNFPSLTTCTQFCDSAACAPGEETYRLQGSAAPQSCLVGATPGSTSGCPLGYDCVLDALKGSNVCCGAPVGEECPAGLRTYLDAFSGQPRTCTINSIGGCPNGFTCLYSVAKATAFCCESNIANLGVCGTSATPFVVNNGQSLGCAAAGAPGGCPADYVCQAGTPDRSSYFCCRSTAPVVNPVTVQGCPTSFLPTSQLCNPFIPNGCGVGNLCQYSPISFRYQCCAKQSPTPAPVANLRELNSQVFPSATICVSGCLNGQAAVSSGTCFTSQVHSCPYGSTCQSDLTRTRNICCASSVIQPTAVACPLGGTAVLLNGAPRSCTLGAAYACPTMSACTSVPGRGNFCCPQTTQTTATCPSRRYPDLSSGQPRPCSSGCVAGYACVLGPPQPICCSNPFVRFRSIAQVISAIETPQNPLTQDDVQDDKE